MKAQEVIDIILLGPSFTFSHEAAIAMFPEASASVINFFFEASPKKIVEEVASGRKDYGVVPVENSATGIISQFYKPLLDQDFADSPDGFFSKVQITKELFVPVRHHLLTRTELSQADIKKIYTFEQPYLQCEDFISSHVPSAQISYTSSTSEAADKVIADMNNYACIGSDLLAREKGLIKVEKNIQDYSKNTTRFFAITSKNMSNTGKNNKTTLGFIILDDIGTLCDVLSIIKNNGINLINIGNFPIRAAHIFPDNFKDWFIVDLAVDATSSKFRRLLDSFRSEKVMMIHKVLGSYHSEFANTPPKEFVTNIPTPPQEESVLRLIEQGESENLEFKSSLRYDINKKEVNKELTKVAAKSICGFLNTKGGKLIIGVSDTGEIIGIENDISVLSKKTVDSFQSTFYEIVSNNIGKEFSQYINLQIVNMGKAKIAVVTATASPNPAWFKGQHGETPFYIRVGNSTKQLSAREAMEYLSTRRHALAAYV